VSAGLFRSRHPGVAVVKEALMSVDANNATVLTLRTSCRPRVVRAAALESILAAERRARAATARARPHVNGVNRLYGVAVSRITYSSRVNGDSHASWTMAANLVLRTVALVLATAARPCEAFNSSTPGGGLRPPGEERPASDASHGDHGGGLHHGPPWHPRGQHPRDSIQCLLGHRIPPVLCRPGTRQGMH
jgi:hypothetical protein